MAYTRKPAKKKADTSAPIKVLSDKEIVLQKYPGAELGFHAGKNKYLIFSDSEKLKPLHSGLAKTESDAWKRAAQECI